MLLLFAASASIAVRQWNAGAVATTAPLAVAALLLMGAWVSRGFPAEPQKEWTPPPAKLRELLLQTRAELEWPGLDAKTAAKNLGSAERALAFVRDEVDYVSYRGAFGDAASTLRTRVANSVDKAVLLASLLKELGVPVRLARSDWPVGATPHRAPPQPRACPSLEALRAFAAPHAKDFAGDQKRVLDAAAVRAKEDSERIYQETSKTRQQIMDLLRREGLADHVGAAVGQAPVRETDWVWVQAKLKGDVWSDLDPVFPAQPRPANADTAFQSKPVVVALSVEAVGADGKANGLLAWQGLAAQLLGNDVTIAFLPADQGTKSLSAIKLDEVKQWKPIFQIGPVRQAGAAFAAGKAQAAEPEKKSGGGGLFGGGGGLFGAPKEAPKPAGAAYLKLSIATADPGSPAPWKQTVSRVLQDLSGSFTPHELVSTHRIGYAVAGVPSRVVKARVVDELLDFYRLSQAASGVKSSDESGLVRGIPVRMARVFNALLGALARWADGDVAAQWRGPGLFLESSRLRKVGDQIANAIETGDDSKLNDPATDDYFRNLAQKLMSALAAGALRGYTEGVIGALAGPFIPGGNAGSFATGAGLSYAPLPQVEPETVEGVMRSYAPGGE